MKSIVASSFARRHCKWLGSSKFRCFDSRSLSALTENLKHNNRSSNDKNYVLMMALFVGIAAISVYFLLREFIYYFERL